MRRSRCDDKNLHMLVSETPQEIRAGKRRRTVLEAFQGMNLKTNDDYSQSDCNSSLATVGSIDQEDHEYDSCIDYNNDNNNNDDDDNDDDDHCEEKINKANTLLINKEEKSRQTIVYQLVLGTQHKDVVNFRLDEMIRQTRLQHGTEPAKDDFQLELQARIDKHEYDMDVDASATTKRSRSNSLPQHFNDTTNIHHKMHHTSY